MEASDDMGFAGDRNGDLSDKADNQVNATEVKPLSRRKKKVKLDPEAKAKQNLSGSIKLDSSLTEPWCGPLENTEDPGPHPGPFNTTLFWMRHGHNLDPIPGRVHEDPVGAQPAFQNHVKSSEGVTQHSTGVHHRGNGMHPTSSAVHNTSNGVNHAGTVVNYTGTGVNQTSTGGNHISTGVHDTTSKSRHNGANEGRGGSGVNFTDGTIPWSPNIAPWKQGKHLIRVFLHVTFRKVGQIDTVSETFNADVIIQARWRYDEELFGAKTDDKGNTQVEWSPRLYIENTGSSIIKTQGREFWIEPTTGDEYVIERLTARGTFTETMELDHFPFDCQNLTVTVASERSSGQITLSPDPFDPSYLHQGNFVDKQEWHLFEHVDAHEPEGYESDIAMTLTRRPALSFTCQAARKIGYFTWNVFLLLVIIFLMHMCSFSVAKTAYNARLSASFTMFLTAIAFKVALNQYLPRISYLTYMDMLPSIYRRDSQTRIEAAQIWGHRPREEVQEPHSVLSPKRLRCKSPTCMSIEIEGGSEDSYLLIQLVLMAFVCGWHATITHLNASVETEQIIIIIISVLYVLFQIIFVAIAYFIPGQRRRELRAKHKAHRQKLLRRVSKSTFA